ncbi:hypothetical protein BG261_02775 [Floricoccus tropicus]|uniref:Siphovirus-type tail component RIFT-related domain-containing protein n=1 Tax=Floricoccus tropicus TaxID=1859473 RepID=A0A1E8GMQ8_9LACT|nr:phage tail domain-containing protein [Floricoccus tropicus]OFI49520.1 hypothetical protein BG261_02775 [Floricoccus tropicus]
MDALITSKKGQFKLSDINISAIDFIISSINKKNYFQELEGRSGRIDFGSDSSYRTIRIPFYSKSKYLYDARMVRDELFSMIDEDEELLIQEISNYSLVDESISPKQYIVRLADNFELKQNLNVLQGELKFETTETPYAKSSLTTQQLQLQGILASDSSWAWGMGLETVDDTELIYTHNAESTATFKVFNAGNVEVHPFESMLNITIKKVAGSTTRFKLKNLTTDSKITINKPVANTDVWRYEGANVTRNKLAALKDTAKDFIFLKPGWNTFQIYDCTSASIEFDFKFLYR